MTAKKQTAVEIVQALMLKIELQKDYLEAALDAAVNEDYSTVEMYLSLVHDKDKESLDMLRNQQRSAGLN